MKQLFSDSSCDAIRSKHANQYQQFIVYKKVNGQTLFDILMDPQYYKMISPKFITSIFGECMKAIKLAAEKYVYHLDIHSENVLFESRISPDITNLPEIRIIDYGFGALKVNDGKDWEMVFPHLIPTELGAKFSKKGAASIDIKYLFLTLFRDIDCKVIREWNSEEMQIKYERELLILNTLWNRIFPDEKESWSLTETILNNGVCREGEFSPEHKFSGFCDYRKRFDCLLDESTFVSIDDVHSILHGL